MLAKKNVAFVASGQKYLIFIYFLYNIESITKLCHYHSEQKKIDRFNFPYSPTSKKTKQKISGGEGSLIGLNKSDKVLIITNYHKQ